MASRDIAGSRHPLIAALFLACAIALGGGGTPNPATEVLLQMVFVVAALAWLWIPPQQGAVPVPRSAAFWLVAFLAILLPLIQLIPLPPSLWTALPGNDDRVAALALVGRENSWQPLTHSAPRTLASLVAIVPALFAFFAAAALDARGRSWMVGAIVATVLLAAVFGALQASLGPDSAPYLYAQNSPTLTGFQANRNAAVDVFLIGMVAAAALLVPSLMPGNRRDPRRSRTLIADRRAAGIVLAAILFVLFFAIVLTASRTGIALIPLALLGVWVIVWPALADRGLWRFAPAGAALLAVPIVAVIALRGGNTALAGVADRFLFAEDGRRELWQDGWFAATQAWPFGIGMGGAQPALVAVERLEVLDFRSPNRVHNDYLELALEGGLPALALLAAIVLILIVAAGLTWRRRPDERHLTALGVVILLVAAFHSFVDYPLRSMALACLIGTGAGLVLSTPRKLAAAEPGALVGDPS
jgi:O-antigen ligase